MEFSLDDIVQLLQASDSAKRLDGADLLKSYFENGDLSRLRDDVLVKDIISGVAGMIKTLNQKVCHKGLDTLQLLLGELGSSLRHQLNPVLAVIFDRLTTIQLRDQIFDLLDQMSGLMGARHFLEKVVPVCSHKIAGVRQHALTCVERVIAAHGSQAIFSDLVTATCKLLDDSAKEVRDEAQKALGTMYGVVDDRQKFKHAVQKRGLQPARWEQLMDVFDHIDATQPQAENSTRGGDETERGSKLARPASTGSSLAVNTSPVKSPVRRKTAPATGSINTKKPMISVAEDQFTNFSDCPPVREGISEKRLEASVNKLMTISEADWDHRCKALRDFRSCLNSGAHTLPNFPQLLRKVVFKLEEDFIPNLRSQVCKEACITIAHIAHVLKGQLEQYVVPLMAALLKILLKNMIFVESGNNAIIQIIKNVPSQRVADKVIHEAITDKSADIRIHAANYILLALHSWDRSVLAKCNMLEDILKAGIEDATPACRNTCRQAFWVFHTSFPERAGQLLLKLDPTRQKEVRKAAGVSSAQEEKTVTTSRQNSLIGQRKPGIAATPANTSHIQAPHARLPKPAYSSQTSQESFKSSSNADTSFMGAAGPVARVQSRGAPQRVLSASAAPATSTPTPNGLSARATSAPSRGHSWTAGTKVLTAARVPQPAVNPLPPPPAPQGRSGLSPKRAEAVGGSEEQMELSMMAGRASPRPKKVDVGPLRGSVGGGEPLGTKVDRLARRLEARPMWQEKLDVFVALEGIVSDPAAFVSAPSSLMDKVCDLYVSHMEENNIKVASHVYSGLERLLAAHAHRISRPVLVTAYKHSVARATGPGPSNRAGVQNELNGLVSGQDRVAVCLRLLADSATTEKTKVYISQMMTGGLLDSLGQDEILLTPDTRSGIHALAVTATSGHRMDVKIEAINVLSLLRAKSPSSVNQAIESFAPALRSSVRAALEAQGQSPNLAPRRSSPAPPPHASNMSPDSRIRTNQGPLRPTLTSEFEPAPTGSTTTANHPTPFVSDNNNNEEEANGQESLETGTGTAREEVTEGDSKEGRGPVVPLEEYTWAQDEWDAISAEPSDIGMHGLENPGSRLDETDQWNQGNGVPATSGADGAGVGEGVNGEMDVKVNGNEDVEFPREDLNEDITMAYSPNTPGRTPERLEEMQMTMAGIVPATPSRGLLAINLNDDLPPMTPEGIVLDSPQFDLIDRLDFDENTVAAMAGLADPANGVEDHSSITPITSIAAPAVNQSEVRSAGSERSVRGRKGGMMDSAAFKTPKKVPVTGLEEYNELKSKNGPSPFSPSPAVKERIIAITNLDEHLQLQLRILNEGCSPPEETKALMDVLQLVRAGDAGPCIDHFQQVLDTLVFVLNRTNFFEVKPSEELHHTVQLVFKIFRCMIRSNPGGFSEDEVYRLVMLLLEFQGQKDGTIIKEVQVGAAKTIEELSLNCDISLCLGTLRRVLTEDHPDNIKFNAAGHVHTLLETRSVAPDQPGLMDMLQPLAGLLTHGLTRMRMVGCRCLADLYLLMGPPFLNLVRPYIVHDTSKNLNVIKVYAEQQRQQRTLKKGSASPGAPANRPLTKSHNV